MRIQSEQHFINSIKKFLRDKCTDTNFNLEPREFYIKYVYNNGLADQYINELYFENHLLLDSEITLIWVRERMTLNKEFPTLRLLSDEGITDELINLSIMHKGQSGCYSFWSEDDNIIYIGKAVDVGSRVLQSAKETAKDYAGSIYVRLHLTQNASDASILEIYKITTMKPPRNVKEKYEDMPTIGLDVDIDFQSYDRILGVKDRLEHEQT